MMDYGFLFNHEAKIINLCNRLYKSPQ